MLLGGWMGSARTATTSSGGTTYSVATETENGLMSAVDKTKLDGVAAGAQVNPAAATDAQITAGTSTAVAGVSPAQLKLSAQTFGSGATYSVATTSADGLMASTDKSKLDGIAAGAQVNPAAMTDATAAAGTDTTTSTVTAAQIAAAARIYGASASGTAFPSSTTAGMHFDRTDLSIRFVRNATNTFWDVKENYGSTGTPNANNDANIGGSYWGYKVGSLWWNKSTGALYRCVNNSDGAAVWVQIGGGSTYPVATETTDGLQSAADKTKLNGIAAGAQVNPTAATDAQITAGTSTAVAGVSPAQLKLSAQTFGSGATYSVATTSADGLMASTDKAKLDGVADGAQVNPTDLDGVPDSTSRIAMIPAERTKLAGVDTGAQVNPTAATDAEITAGTSTAVSGVTPAQLKLAAQTFGGSTYSVATESANGLLSSTDKTKLDGIDAGAQVNPAAATYAQIVDGTSTTVAGVTPAQLRLSAETFGSGTTYSVATESANGLMSATDKKKLDGASTSATVDLFIASVGGNVMTWAFGGTSWVAYQNTGGIRGQSSDLRDVTEFTWEGIRAGTAADTGTYMLLMGSPDGGTTWYWLDGTTVTMSGNVPGAAPTAGISSATLFGIPVDAAGLAVGASNPTGRFKVTCTLPAVLQAASVIWDIAMSPTTAGSITLRSCRAYAQVITAGTGGGSSSAELDNSLTVFVAKGGSDANNGLSANRAKATIGAAVTAAAALSPSTTNRVGIVVVGGGTFTENVTIPQYVTLSAPTAVIAGTLTVEPDTYASVFGVTPPTGANAIAAGGSGGTKYASVSARFVTVTGTGNGATNSATGVWLDVDIGTLSVDTGTGIGGGATAGIIATVREIILGSNSAVGITTSGGAIRVLCQNIARVSSSVTASTAISLTAGVTFDVIVGTINVGSTGTAWNVDNAAAIMNIAALNVTGTGVVTSGTVNKLGTSTSGGGGGSPDAVDFCGFLVNVPATSDTVATYLQSVAWNFTPTTCVFYAETAPSSGSPVFTLKKNGATTVGTVTFAAGEHTGVVSGSVTSFAAGDRISVVSPSNVYSIADISYVITGTLDDARIP